MVGIAADQVRVVHNLKTGKTLGIKISDDLRNFIKLVLRVRRAIS
jgi:hypothetical protein